MTYNFHSRHGFRGRLFRWEGKIAFQTRPKWMLNFMLKPFRRNLFKNADLFCCLASSFNSTARLHTWSALKTGLLPTAVNSLVKTNGLQTRLTLTLWTTMYGELCLNATSHFNPNHRTSMTSRKFCSWYGTSCHKTQSRKPYWASRRRLQECVKAGDGRLRTYAKMNYLSDFGITACTVVQAVV